MKLTLALMLLGSSALVAHNSNAAQALAVASNGKWAVAYDRTTDVKAVSAQALAKCKTRGGTTLIMEQSRFRTMARARLLVGPSKLRGILPT